MPPSNDPNDVFSIIDNITRSRAPQGQQPRGPIQSTEDPAIDSLLRRAAEIDQKIARREQQLKDSSFARGLSWLRDISAPDWLGDEGGDGITNILRARKEGILTDIEDIRRSRQQIVDQGGYGEGGFGAAVERGLGNAQSMYGALGAMVNDVDSSDISNIIEGRSRTLRAGRGREEQEAYERFQAADGLWASAKELFTNPREMTNIAIESLPSSVPSIAGSVVAGGATGIATRNAVAAQRAAAVGGGLGSFVTEYGNAMLETLANNGVDLDSPEALEQAIRDPKIMEEARDRGVKRGIAVGTFDAMSIILGGKLGGGRIANKIIGDTASAGTARRVAGYTAGGLVETGAQGAFGAAGEAAGQLATEGEITSPQDIVAEFAGEIPTGVVESAVGSAIQTRRDQNTRTQEDTELARALSAFAAQRGGQTETLALPDGISQELRDLGDLRVGDLSYTGQQLYSFAENNMSNPRIADIMSQPVSAGTKVQQVARVMNEAEAARVEPEAVRRIAEAVGGTTSVSKTKEIANSVLSQIDDHIIDASPTLSAIRAQVSSDKKSKDFVADLREITANFTPSARSQTLTARPYLRTEEAPDGGRQVVEDGSVIMTPDQAIEDARQRSETEQAFRMADRRQERFDRATGTGQQREDLRAGAPEPEAQFFLGEMYGDLAGTPATIVAASTRGRVSLQYETNEVDSSGAPIIVSEEMDIADVIGRVNRGDVVARSVRGTNRMSQDLESNLRNPDIDPRTGGRYNGIVGSDMNPRRSVDRTRTRAVTAPDAAGGVSVQNAQQNPMVDELPAVEGTVESPSQVSGASGVRQLPAPPKGLPAPEGASAQAQDREATYQRYRAARDRANALRKNGTISLREKFALDRKITANIEEAERELDSLENPINYDNDPRMVEAMGRFDAAIDRVNKTENTAEARELARALIEEGVIDEEAYIEIDEAIKDETERGSKHGAAMSAIEEAIEQQRDNVAAGIEEEIYSEADQRAGQGDTRYSGRVERAGRRTVRASEVVARTPLQRETAAPDDAAPDIDYQAVIDDRLSKIEARGAQGKIIAKRLRGLLKDKVLTAPQLYAAFRGGEVASKILPKNSKVDILWVPVLTADNAQAAQNSGTQVGEEAAGSYQAYDISQNGFRGIIKLSLSDNVSSLAEENAAHEAFHVIQDMLRVYDPKAFEQLNTAFRNGMRIDDLDASILRKLKTITVDDNQSVYDSLKGSFGDTPLSKYEAQAVAFGALVDAKNRGVDMKGLKASFIRVVDFASDLFREIGRLLRRDGITNPATIFEGYRTGKFQESMDAFEGQAPTQSELNQFGMGAPERYSARTKPDPIRTQKAYKLFRVKEGSQGQLFPLFVKANEPVAIGQWLDADIGESAGETKTGRPQVKSKIGPLALRAGWHAGDLPIATHIGSNPSSRRDPETGKTKKLPTVRPADQVWAEVELAADRDWQDEANKRAKRNARGEIVVSTAQITDEIPEDGFYRYKTNPNMTGNWLISGSMKVNRILSDEEVAQINDAAGVSDLPREAPFDAAKYGLDTGTRYSGRVQRGAKAEGEDKRISTRFPTAKKSNENPLTDNLIVGLESLKTDQAAFAYNINLLKSYPDFGTTATEPDKIAEDFILHVEGNLLYLHDLIPAGQRSRARKWYDGARSIVNRWMNKYDQSDATLAGVLAALSPQKDWFMNVSLAERVLDVMTMQQDHVWDARMDEVARTKFDIAKKKKLRVAYELAQGKALKDIDDIAAKAMFVRVYDETYHDRAHRVVTPEGDFASWVLTQKGKKSGTGWGSLVEIGKAVAVIVDPSPENISQSMGDKHKVRNFFNNIISPNSPFGDVTIDTHAVAAALLRPLSGASLEVNHNFGTTSAKGMVGTKNSSVTGNQGLYGLYAEAYRRAAEKRGILPREMQSITWEAIRAFYPAKFKTKNNIDRINVIWSKYKDRELSLNEVRNQVYEIAGELEQFAWDGPRGTDADQAGDSSYAGELSGDRVSGGASERVDGGTGGRATGAAAVERYSGRTGNVEAELAAQLRSRFQGTPVVEAKTPREGNVGRKGGGVLASTVSGRVPVAATYSHSDAVKAVFNESGYGAPDFHELTSGKAAARLYSRLINDSKRDNLFGASVYAYPQEDYEGMRLFVTKDGLAGFALKGDDIVSAFKSPASKDRGVAFSMVRMAVALGGRRLDAFDTVLPEMYSVNGFRAVARMRWNDEYAPEGWSKETFEEFNNGEPDVVFMAYDPKRDGIYAPDEGEYTEDYDDAVARQTAAAKGERYSARVGGSMANRLAAKAPPRPNAPKFRDGPSLLGADTRSARRAFLENQYERFVNRALPIKQLVKEIGDEFNDSTNFARAEVLMGSVVATQTRDFRNEEIIPLLREISARGLTVEEVETYLHNKHAEERNTVIAGRNELFPDGGSGIATEDARRYLASLSDAKRKGLEAVEKKVRTITDGTLQLMVDSGVESPAAVAALRDRYKNWVPLFREGFDGGNPIGGRQRGSSVEGSSLKAAIGSERGVKNIIYNIVSQRESAINRAENNRLSGTVLRAALENPDPAFWMVIDPSKVTLEEIRDQLVRMSVDPEIAEEIYKAPRKAAYNKNTGMVESVVDNQFKRAPNVVATRVEGTDKFIVFNPSNELATRVAQALRNDDMPINDGLSGILVELIGPLTRIWSQMRTQYSPEFGPVNFVRDVENALINLDDTPLSGKQGAVFVKAMKYGNVFRVRNSNLIRVISAADSGRAVSPKDQKLADLFGRFEKAGGRTTIRNTFFQSDNPKKIEAQMKKAFKQIAAGRKSMPAEVASAVTVWNDTLEIATRLAIFETAIESGMTDAQAAELAKTTTVNFQQKGQLTRELNAGYGFFNASIAGNSRNIQVMLSKSGKKIALWGVGLGVMQGIMLAMAGYEEDEPPEWVKDNAFIIPIPFTDKYFPIPMLHFYRAFPAIGRRMVETARGQLTVGEFLTGSVRAIVNAVNPLAYGASFVEFAAPSVLDMGIQYWQNLDGLGRRIYNEDFNDLNPTTGMSRARGDMTMMYAMYSKIAEGINAITFGDEFTRGWFSPTPEEIKFFVEETAPPIRFVYRSFGVAEKLFMGDDVEAIELPFLRRFYGERSGKTVEGGKFYENVLELNELRTTIRGRDEAGVDTSDIYEQNPIAELTDSVGSYYREVSDLRRERRRLILEGKDRAEVRARDEEITAKMKEFNDLVAEYREAEE